ncbi:MAG: 50S ribosomal protein L33 [Mycoplasma sp.]|nr:50S ribosomal protein L33 [Candidatus Hennigella equi]
MKKSLRAFFLNQRLFMRKKVILVCDECLSRNYHITKNTLSTERIVLNKYCPKCKKVTKHKETR